MINENGHIAFTPDTILDGRFSIIKKIGEGGMGEVYLAFDRRMSRQVAVKRLKTTMVSTESDKRRFLQESKLCAQINHRNVIKVIDAFFHGQCPCFAMEYVEGNSLWSYFDNHRKPDVTIPVIIDALDAINGAHEISIIHRDLKPSNIFITSDGIVKVGDWGIATAADDPTGMTETGMILGTPEYIAPERITKGKSLPQGDIYSMGCILYEALCGRPPFIGDIGQIISAHVKEIPKFPAGINFELRTFIDKLLTKNEKLRPSNAMKVKDELEQIFKRLKGEGIDIFFTAETKKNSRSADPTDTTQKNVRLSDCPQNKMTVPPSVPKKNFSVKNSGIQRTMKLITALLCLLAFLGLFLIPRILQKGNSTDDKIPILALKTLISKVSTKNFKTIEVRYDSTLKGEYSYEIIQQKDSSPVDGGFIKFSDALTPNGRTSLAEITLNKTCYKKINLRIGSDPGFTFPVDMMDAWSKSFKVLTGMNNESKISLYKNLEFIGGTGSPSKEEFMEVLELHKIDSHLLNRYEELIPLYLDYLDYSNKLYMPEVQVLEPLREMSSFLSQRSIHSIFGLTSQLMGFQFSKDRDLNEIPNWTTVSQKSLEIDRHDDSNHFPVLVYKYDEIEDKEAILAHSDTTSKLLNLAFKDRERRDRDDYHAVFKCSLPCNKNLQSSISWPPQKAFLDIIYQSYGDNNYFCLSINGHKKIKVYTTCDFRIFIGRRVMASIPIPPSWLNDRLNIVEIFAERLTQEKSKDLLQTTLTHARIRGQFIK